ncbi:MAG TPA: DUF5916 domain-containing protein, partial [Blastocatellia bacterium]|nr:DUF5916 domain-containing protein [Blastocatellia bacterium]
MTVSSNPTVTRTIGTLLLFLIVVTAYEVSASAHGLAPADSPKKDSVKGKVVVPPEKAGAVRIPKFAQPPVVDGKLDDEVWKSAAVLRDFYQINPGDNIPPSKPTEVLVGFDEKHIYFAFHAYDDPSSVRATVPKRDSIWDDDYVGIFLDTFNDKRKAYCLFFSALGIQADGILTEGGGEDYSLDIVMESKGLVGPDGYAIEVSVPFKSLRYEAGPGKIWNAHFFRRIKRLNNELDSWMPVSKDISGTLNQAGRITGIEGIATERTLEIIPVLTISESGQRVPTLSSAIIANNPTLVDPGRFVNHPAGFDPGVSVKLGISSNVTLDFTANPDFAQVEADQPVITANQRFPIFFDEKRPFFLEGIDIFQTPVTAVHTRTIIDPDLAVKLSGKTGRNTFGLMMASDNAPGNFSEAERNDPGIFPDIERFIGKNALIGVVRLKRDVGKESSLGFVGTSYNFVEHHNQLAGFDGRFRLDQQTVVTFQVLGSSSRRFFYDPNLDQNVFRTGNGLAYFGQYNKWGRHVGINFMAEGQSTNYRSDVGFNRRTNTNRDSLFFRYESTAHPKNKLILWRIFSGGGVRYDWQGHVQNIDSSIEYGLSFTKQTYVGGGFGRGYERVFEAEFGPNRGLGRPGAFFGDSERSTQNESVWSFIESNPTKRFSGFFFFGYNWNVFDFDFGAGPRFPRVSPPALIDPNAPLDPGPGRLLDLNANVNYQPTTALRTELRYNHSRLVRDDTGLVSFEDNIFSSRTTYQFTRFLFARARIDYSTLSSSTHGQFLIGWTPNPGTSFYAGYNDDLNYRGFNPFTGQREP